MNERSFNRNESATPRHPSNRSFITQMERWGWTIRKSGELLTMRAPLGNETVQVQPANKHDANATSVMMTVYRLTTQGDADLFWRGPSQMWLDMIALKQEEEAAARRPRRPDPPVAHAVPEHAPPPADVKTEPPTPERARCKRMSTREGVYGVLAEHTGRGTLTATMVARRLGLDPNEEQERRSVNNHLSALFLEGRVDRPKMGHYRVPSPRPSRPGQEAVLSTPMPVVAQPVAPAAPAPPPPPAPAPVAPAESVDDVIEAVLDLLLPGGFKAQDLRVIQPWIDATKLMVGTVAR